MTSLATGIPAKSRGPFDGKFITFPMQASAEIQEGWPVIIGRPDAGADVAGHARVADTPATYANTHEFVGIAVETQTEGATASTLDGIKCRCDGATHEFVASGLTDEDTGKDAYLVDNRTIQTTPTLSGWRIGKIARVKSATRALVKLRAYNERKADAGIIDVATAASSNVTNTNSETDFDQQVSIPANFLEAEMVLDISGLVTVPTTNSTDTLVIKVYIAGTAFLTTAAIDVANSDQCSWQASVYVRTIGASGVLVASGVIYGPDAGNVSAGHGGGAVISSVDTTAAIVVKASATWSVASTSNICALQSLQVGYRRNKAG